MRRGLTIDRVRAGVHLISLAPLDSFSSRRSLWRRTPFAFPLRGRWHGAAVTDEVGFGIAQPYAKPGASGIDMGAVIGRPHAAVIAGPTGSPL